MPAWQTIRLSFIKISVSHALKPIWLCLHLHAAFWSSHHPSHAILVPDVIHALVYVIRAVQAKGDVQKSDAKGRLTHLCLPCRSHYRAAVAMALDESEAFAPFVALLALHVKGVLHTIWAILRLLALLPGVNILASGLARVVLRCWGAVLQVAAFVRLAAVAALQWEMSVLTLLCCGLATVLWVRKRMRTRNFSRPGAA